MRSAERMSHSHRPLVAKHETARHRRGRQTVSSRAAEEEVREPRKKRRGISLFFHCSPLSSYPLFFAISTYSTDAVSLHLPSRLL